MIQWKSLFVRRYVCWKTRPNFKELNKMPVNIPVEADKLKNILIILPKRVEYVDSALALVRELRRHFTQWHYMMLDIDKILSHKLNRLNLPNEEFIGELEKDKFDLVLDLNFDFNIRILYIIGMLKIPYRLHLQSSSDNYYNIIVRANRTAPLNFDFVVNYLQTIFLK